MMLGSALLYWSYYMDGYFENNSNYDNTEDLYQHLLDKWKFCWIVDKAKGQRGRRI